MLLHRLKNTRRYACLSSVDIHKIYDNMRKSGKILFNPVKWDSAMIPRSWGETCTVCILCRKIVHHEGHFKHFHNQLSYYDLKSISHIGKVLFNRLTSPGSMEEYPKGKHRSKTLLDRMQAMYGTIVSSEVKRPCRTVQQQNRHVNKINTLLKQLLLSGDVGTGLSVSLKNFEVTRTELTKYNNLFCTLCAKWVDGKWNRHRDLKHKGLSTLQHKAVLLYSARLKSAALANVLLVEKNAILKVNQKDFFDFMERSHYTLNKILTVALAVATAKDVFCWFFGVKRSRVIDNHTVTYGKLKSVFEKPLNTAILNLAYRRINQLYGGDVDGFTDCLRYTYTEITAEMRRDFQAACPPEHDCINFMYVETKKAVTKRIGHVVLCHWKAAEKVCVIYDGTEYVRTEPIRPYLKNVILAHHSHSGLPVRAGFSREYPVQGDKWSCSYRAVFACLALLYGQNPENFNADLEQIFFIIKWAVEKNGRKLGF